MINAALSRLRKRVPTGDAGTSLMELIIGMALMAIFMSIFTGAIVMMTQTGNKVEAVSLSAAQNSQAFLKLDKTVRYATSITAPGISAVSGNWYVEMDTTNTGIERCTQFRIDKTALQLQQRTWTISNSVASAASGWTTMASYITNGGAASGSATAPFVIPAAANGASTNFQRLRITLVATSGNAQTSTMQSQMTFTALNSTTTTPGTSCQQWGRP
jgi:hypothetical protein